MAFNVSYIIQIKDKYSAIANKIKAKTTGMTSSFKRLQSQVKKTGSQIKKMASGSIGLLGTMATALIAATGIRTLLEFGKEMSKVKALTGATGDEFQLLKNQAKLLGKTTQFTAAQAASGMAFLAQAGFDTNKILGAMPEILDLAAAGSLDLASAADIVSNIMTPFGISADKTKGVVDALAVAASSSNTNIQQLGGAMKNVAPVASSLGISLTTTAAAIGALGDSGIQSERAGTGLKIVLQRLVRPVGEVKRGIKALRIDASKLNPATNDMVVIFERLNARLAQIKDPAKRAAITVAIFGQEAAAVGTTLIKSVDKIKELNKTMKTSSGVASDMAKIMRDNLQGDVDAATSAFSGLIIGVGDKGLGGGLRSLVRGFTQVIGMINRMSNAFPGVTKDIVILVGVLMGMAATVAVIAKVSAAMAALNIIILANPIGATIAALVISIAFLISHWDDLKQAMQNIVDFWSGPLLSGLAVVSGVINEIIGLINSVFGLSEGEIGVDVRTQQRDTEKEAILNRLRGPSVASQTFTNNARIDGNINVNAAPGTVSSVQSNMTGANIGGLGLNMAGAGA